MAGRLPSLMAELGGGDGNCSPILVVFEALLGCGDGEVTGFSFLCPLRKADAALIAPSSSLSADEDRLSPIGTENGLIDADRRTVAGKAGNWTTGEDARGDPALFLATGTDGGLEATRVLGLRCRRGVAGRACRGGGGSLSSSSLPSLLSEPSLIAVSAGPW